MGWSNTNSIELCNMMISQVHREVFQPYVSFLLVEDNSRYGLIIFVKVFIRGHLFDTVVLAVCPSNI